MFFKKHWEVTINFEKVFPDFMSSLAKYKLRLELCIAMTTSVNR